MPTVPYRPVPDVAASQQATPSVDVATPIEAFGGGVSRAIGTVGQTIDKAGDEIFQRAIALQNLENETIAKETDAKYVMRLGEIRARYQALQGEQAVRAYPQFIREAQLLRHEYRRNLPNDMTRRMFDGPSLSFMSRTVFSGAGHAATENRQWAIGASTARIASQQDWAQQNPDDRDGFEGSVATVRSEVRGTLRSANGWSEEETRQREAVAVSRLYSQRLVGMSRTQPFEAKAFLEANRGNMVAADIERAERVVYQSLHQAGSRRISEEVNPPPTEGDPGPTLEERIAAGRRRAEEIAPDDPGFADFVRDRIITDYNRFNGIRREQTLANRNIIDGALIGNEGGRVPTTVEELIATSPQVREAWENMNQTQQRGVMRSLQQNARGDIAWNQERLNRYQELKGLAQENPTEFLNTSVVNEQMPWSARRELIALQQSVSRRPEGDPRITAAMRSSASLLDAAGIGPNQDRSRYLQFRGSLQEVIQEFQREKNRFPNQTEVQEMTANLLRQQTTPGVFGQTFWPRQTPLFEIPVPPDVRERFENDPRWGGRTPSEAETRLFQQRYIARKYQEMFGGAQPKQQRPQLPAIPQSR